MNINVISKQAFKLLVGILSLMLMLSAQAQEVNAKIDFEINHDGTCVDDNLICSPVKEFKIYKSGTDELIVSSKEKNTEPALIKLEKNELCVDVDAINEGGNSGRFTQCFPVFSKPSLIQDVEVRFILQD